MDFHIEQVIAAPPAEVARVFTDPAFYEALGALESLGRPEVLDRGIDGDVVDLEVRYRFAGELSSAARKVLDPKKLTWIEHSRHDLAACTATFRIVPDHYADRLTASGRYRFVAEGDGSRRIADGSVGVRAVLVGRAVERAIISGMQRHSDDEVALIEDFLNSNT